MLNYSEAMRVLQGSKRYEFDEQKLIVTDYHTEDEVVLDFANMTEEMFEEMSTGDVEYEEAMDILMGSKQYQFSEGTDITITGYFSGQEMTLDFGFMTEEMYEDLVCDESLDDDFEDAINAMDSEDELAR